MLIRYITALTLAATAILVAQGCEEKADLPSSESAAPAVDEPATSVDSCLDYRESVRETCIDSFREGLPVSCHRIVTRANATGSNAELCQENLTQLKAERAKKLEHSEKVLLGEACEVFVEKLDTACLSRLGPDFPPQCGGVLVAIAEPGADVEEACRASATLLGRL
jgi:hypothetical protein